MNLNFAVLFLLLQFLLITPFAFAQSSDKPDMKPSIAVASSKSEGLRGNGMRFTQNKGQIIDMGKNLRPDILFKGDGGGADVYLRKTGMSYVLSNMGEVMSKTKEQLEEMKMAGIIDPEDEEKTKEKLMEKQLLKVNRIDVDFVHCNIETKVITADQVEGYNNYYYAHCPGGITLVNSYNEVTVKNVYNNIDVKYYGAKAKGLKYDIVVYPGGNPNDIKLKYSGAEELQIANEKLKIKTSLGELGEYMPKVYQNIDGEIIDVKTHYVLHETTVSFELGTWNPEYSLVIDPWISYYGGTSTDAGISTTTDVSGNVLFTGVTKSVDFPVTAGAFQNTYTGGTQDDVFVVKMNSGGNLLWATYYGGTSDEVGNGIAADGENVLVAGRTNSTDLPVGAIAGNTVHQATYGAGIAAGDAFLLKLDTNGSRVWATYYGGAMQDYGYDVTTFGGIIYFYGISWSNNAITTGSAFQAANNGIVDVFIVKFTSAGVRVWGTFVGGAESERASGGIACDASGNVFIAGTTASEDFPVLAGAQMTFGSLYGSVDGTADEFICKFNSAGLMVWSTYYGGARSESSLGIAVDNTGDIIIVGETESANSISTVGSYQPAYGGGGKDGHIVKFNNAGTLLWGTYLGGNTDEWMHGGVATDVNNNIYVYGEWEDTNSGNYPISPCAYQTSFGGGIEDQFIARYDANGIQHCFTYIGGTGHDDLDAGLNNGGAIAIYGSLLYITGTTDGGYPVTAGAFQMGYGGTGVSGVSGSTTGDDAFIDQFCINICEAKVLSPNFTASTATVCANSNAPIVFTPTVNTSCDTITEGYKFLWTFTSGTPSTSTAVNPSVIFSGAGTHNVQLTVTTPCKTETVTKSAYITVNNCSFTANVTGTNVLCSGQTNGTAIATPIGGTAPFSFLWSNGATTQTITGLAAGTYTVTITDAAPATTVLSITITAPSVISATAAQISPTNCNSNNGVASVNPVGGTGSYTYNWSSGATGKTAFNLAVGTYSVTVRDANGCSVIKTATIVLPSQMTLTMSSTAATCSSNNGSASVVVAGGSGAFLYSWSPGGRSLQIASGTYTVSVTDIAYGCTKTGTVTVAAASTAPTVTFTQSPTGTVCIGKPVTFTNTGSAGLTNWLIGPILPADVSGTTANFTYTFLKAGTYKVFDRVYSGGCAGTATSTVTVIDCSAGPSVIATGSSVCSGSCTTVAANSTSGTSPYTYSWSTGATTQNINPCLTSTTTYTVKVTDKTGASATTTATVTVYPAVTAGATAGVINCSGNTGSATATGAGGISPYTFNWNNSGSGSVVSGLAEGTYTVTITDSKGCTATSTTVLVSPPPLLGQFTKGTAACSNCGCQEWLMVNATGGTPPYTYQWPDGYDKRYKNKVCPGNYTIKISDKNGCSVNVSITAP